MKRILQFAVLFCVAAKVFFARAESNITNFFAFKTVAMNGAIGNLTSSNGTFHLRNLAANDGIFFVYQPFSWNGQISARVRRPAQSHKVGVVFRQSTNASSPGAGTFLAATNTIFERRLDDKRPPTTTIHTNEIFEWLRVVREGNAFSGFYSSDGTNWIQFSADSIEMPDEIFAGFAMAGAGEATIDEVRMTSAHLASPRENSSYVAPTNVLLSADVASFGGGARRVEFFADTKKIAGANAASFLWNVLAGSNSVTAKVTDDAGAEFFTEPVNCEIKLPPARATFVGIDEKTRGNWKGIYGKTGFLVVNDKTNFPGYIQLTPENALPFTWSNPTNQSALMRADSTIRIASSWNHRHPISLNLSLANGSEQQLALYFLDWDEKGRIMDVQIWNTSGEMLNRKSVYSFIEGTYLVWQIRGKVIIKIASLGGGNPIISGLFFDPK